MSNASDRRTSASRGVVTGTVLAAAIASAGAGLVHAAAAGSHQGDDAVEWLFAVTALAQLAWALLAIARPSRAVLLVGVVLNGGAVLAWALSRTVGLFGPLADVEAVGTQDLIAAILAALAVAVALLATSPRAVRAPANLTGGALAVAVVLALSLPAMASEHAHGSHDLDAAAAHDHDDGAAHDADGHSHATEVDVDGPVVSLDDPRLTNAERERARDLVEETREALAEFGDEAAVRAAGYVSIGDGRRVGSFEHFVQRDYMVDDRELDPSAIESIVLRRGADGTKTVESAMYVLTPGTTMDDVPDLAGELTVWHDHRNLCWDPTGTRLAGVLVDGQCRPGGTLRVTPPMIHVWLEDTPCGPFTGIEGHGGGCEHSH